MQTSTSRSPAFHFGVFELDPRTGELRKKGVKIKLQGQPVEILVMLLQRPGEVVTREELQKKLWPADTFVDFEQGLNNAVKRLRAALDDDAESPRLIETLPRRGYRFVGAVNASESLPSSDAATGTILVASGEASSDTQAAVAVRLSARHKKGFLTVAAAVVISAGLIYGAYRWRSSASASSIDSLAVLPFTNEGGDANTDYLSDGITESLIDNLAHVPQLKVKSRNLVFHYKGKDVDVHKVGNDLGVSALVSGRVLSRGDNIEVSAELIDVRDNTEIWGQRYSVKSADIIVLQRQIAGDIAEKLRSTLSTSEKQQLTKQGTQNPESYNLYLKGIYFTWKNTNQDIHTGISYFNQAIAKDPSYALAYSGLASAYGVLAAWSGAPSENYPKANAAARKAIELDPTLAEPHALLGSVEMFYDWDLAGGEAEFKKAFELDPKDATAHVWYAHAIAQISGREQEALDEVNRAYQLDPYFGINAMVGFTHLWVHQYDEGIAVCERLAKGNPTLVLAPYCLAYGFWAKHLYPQVIEQWKTYSQLANDPNESEFASALEQGFRSGGWKGALRKGIAIRQAQRKSGYSSAFVIATMFAELGDKDQAFRWLNTAYRERDWRLWGSETEFSLDPLRSDPRFAELLRKVGLPQ